MGSLNGLPVLERVKFIFKIFAALLLALSAAAGLAALIVLFIRTAFLPLGVQIAVISLCLALIAADFFIARGYVADQLGTLPPKEPPAPVPNSGQTAAGGDGAAERKGA